MKILYANVSEMIRAKLKNSPGPGVTILGRIVVKSGKYR
jgi:hypothetical protein